MVRRYLVFGYLKYFFLILFALNFFFVGLDYLQAIKHLPSANLQLLYIFYKFLHGMDILFCVSVVFAMIALKIYLIRSNELVALYALGVSKRAVIAPIFFTSIILVLIYLFLHTTPFAYAAEYAKNLKRYHSIISTTKNLFFKYNDSYAFFKTLHPLEKVAKGVRVIDMQGEELKRIIMAPTAFFKNDRWIIEHAFVVENFKDHIQEKKEQKVETLVGYRPKILDSVYEGKTNISLIDAIYALRLLLEQKIATQKLRAILYSQIFYPFFAPFLMIILFYFVPISARMGNLNLFVFGSIIVTLVVWGGFYILIKLAFSKVLLPEVAILLPLVLVAAIALWFYKKF